MKRQRTTLEDSTWYHSTRELIRNKYYVDIIDFVQGDARIECKDRRIVQKTAFGYFPSEYMETYVRNKVIDMKDSAYQSFDSEVPVLNEPCRMHVEFRLDRQRTCISKYAQQIQTDVKSLCVGQSNYSCYILSSDVSRRVRVIFPFIYAIYHMVQNIGTCISMKLCREFVECRRVTTDSSFVSTFSHQYIPCERCGGPSSDLRMHCTQCHQLGYIISGLFKPISILTTQGEYKVLAPNYRLSTNGVHNISLETTLHPCSHVTPMPESYAEIPVVGDCTHLTKRRSIKIIPMSDIHHLYADILHIHEIAETSMSFMITKAIQVRSPKRIYVYVSGYGSNHCRFYNYGKVPHDSLTPSIYFVILPNMQIFQACVNPECQEKMKTFNVKVYRCTEPIDFQ